MTHVRTCHPWWMTTADTRTRGILTSGEDATSPLVGSPSRPLSGGLSRMRFWAVAVALGAWAVGCSEREERHVSAKEEFEIPLTLVQRMMEAHDKAYSNAQEVVAQPRGEMKFADDGLMMRRHQCDRSSMDALAIKSFLETARKRRAPFAAENLAVLRRCVPEVFMKKTDGPL